MAGQFKVFNIYSEVNTSVERLTIMEGYPILKCSNINMEAYDKFFEEAVL